MTDFFITVEGNIMSGVKTVFNCTECGKEVMRLPHGHRVWANELERNLDRHAAECADTKTE